MPSPQSLELTLVRELAAGTFARLYLAEARAPGGIERLIAVKLLREQWNDQPDLLARTADEARLLARLRHRNIVRVEDTATIEGQFALLMEFVDGLDCKQFVEARGGTKHRTLTPGPGNPAAATPARAALAIVAASASALDAAHHKIPYGLDHPLEVVHRDIKPSNLMVSSDGEVKVLDFGTARFAERSRQAQTREMRFGSLKYMSPERREGDRGELPADVYALGLVLLELLRGEWLPVLPLDGAEHDEAIAAYVAALSPGMMPNQDWEDAFHRLIQGMTASNPQWRPVCSEAAQLLRTFHDQASGASIEEFANDAIAPVARANRKLPVEGELAGRRYVVSARAFEPDPRTSGDSPRLVAQEVAGRPRPPEPAREEAAADVSVSYTLPGAAAGAQPSAVRDSQGALTAQLPPPSALPPMAEGDAQFWTSAFARRLPGLSHDPDLSARATIVDSPATLVSGDEDPAGAPQGVNRSFPGAVISHPRQSHAPHPAVPGLVEGQAPSRAPTVPFEPRVLPVVVQASASDLGLNAAGADPQPTVKISRPVDDSIHQSTAVSRNAPARPPPARSIPANHRAPPQPETLDAPAPASPASPAPPAPVDPPEVAEEQEQEQEPEIVAPGWFARIAAIGVGVVFASIVLTIFVSAALGVVYRDRLFGGGPSVTAPVPAPLTVPAPVDAATTAPVDAATTAPVPAEPPGGGAPEASQPAPPEAEAAAPQATAPVQVVITVKSASSQWIHLQSPTGADMAQGNDRCTAQIPEGEYRLVIKLVGRPAVSGTIKLSGAQAFMECVPQPDASVTCAGTGPPVFLKP